MTPIEYDHYPTPDGHWICGCETAKHKTTHEADSCRLREFREPSTLHVVIATALKDFSALDNHEDGFWEGDVRDWCSARYESQLCCIDPGHTTFPYLVNALVKSIKEQPVPHTDSCEFKADRLWHGPIQIDERVVLVSAWKCATCGMLNGINEKNRTVCRGCERVLDSPLEEIK